MPDGYLWRMQEIITLEEDQTGSAQVRMETMKIALQYVIAHPFSEYGLGNHSYHIIEQYGYDPSSIDYSQIFLGGHLAHNIFLQFGADTGLFPMVVYILFIATIYFNLLNTRRKIRVGPATNEYKFNLLMSYGVLASLTGFLIGSFFLPWAYRIFLFYLTGVGVSFTAILQEEINAVTSDCSKTSGSTTYGHK